MPTEKKQKEFGIALIKFYKEFLLGTANSVKLLAEIEHNYPEHYGAIKELKDDPHAIAELSEKLPDDVRRILYSIIVEGSLLARKMNQLFDLNEEQKTKLAGEIKGFSERIERDLSELIKNADKISSKP